MNSFPNLLRTGVFLKTASQFLLGLLVATALTACQAGAGSHSEESVLNNPELKTLKPGYTGNLFQNGEFFGPYTSRTGKSFWPILKWKLSVNPKAEAKKQDTFSLRVIPADPLPAPDKNYILWLGHASFLIHIQGKTILTDPCLFAPPLYKRLAPVPLDIRNIPVDYILISHCHYDHLDKATLRVLTGSPQALVPLKMGALVKSWNRSLTVQEAGWYQQYQTPEGLEIILVPAKHWNRRGAALNQILWGSYVIRSQGKSIYFAGDTGYDTHFLEIERLLGPIDYALLPIAAYDPPVVMQESHLNPAEALQAFRDLKARVLIPMHYGTFDLTDEPLGEPLAWLIREAQTQGLFPQIRPSAVGEVIEINP